MINVPLSPRVCLLAPLEDIIADLGHSLCRNWLSLLLDGKPVASLRLPVFYHTNPKIGNGEPIVAYIDDQLIECDRKNLLQPPSFPNPPLWGIARKRLKAVTPDCPLQDPYILGIMIALGQEKLLARRKAIAKQQGRSQGCQVSLKDLEVTVSLYFPGLSACQHLSLLG